MDQYRLLNLSRGAGGCTDHAMWHGLRALSCLDVPAATCQTRDRYPIQSLPQCCLLLYVQQREPRMRVGSTHRSSPPPGGQFLTLCPPTRAGVPDGCHPQPRGSLPLFWADSLCRSQAGLTARVTHCHVRLKSHQDWGSNP
jgi:hypothetical protein